jgi:hypothetical protein
MRVYLLACRYPDFKSLVPPAHLLPGGLLREWEATGSPLCQEICAYWLVLKAVPDDEVLPLYRKAREGLADVHREYGAFCIDAAAANAAADYDLWSKYPYWTILETAALFLGKNPRIVVWEDVERYAEVDDLAARLRNYRDILERAPVFEGPETVATPADLVGWAKNWIDLPPQLIAAVEASPSPISRWQTEIAVLKAELQVAKQSKPHAKQLTSLEKALLGLAMKFYEHNPNSPRNATASRMSALLDTLGLFVCEQTLKTHLDRAASHLRKNP